MRSTAREGVIQRREARGGGAGSHPPSDGARPVQRGRAGHDGETRALGARETAREDSTFGLNELTDFVTALAKLHAINGEVELNRLLVYVSDSLFEIQGNRNKLEAAGMEKLTQR